MDSRNIPQNHATESDVMYLTHTYILLKRRFDYLKWISLMTAVIATSATNICNEPQSIFF